MQDKSLSVAKQLQKARVELQKKVLKKSGYNKYAGFSYFELRDFLPSVNEIFLTLGLFSQFSIKGEEASLKICLYDKPEEFVEFTSPIVEAKVKGATPIQDLGATHTYLKRYLYVNALEVIEPDTVDAISHQKPKTPSGYELKQKLKTCQSLEELKKMFMSFTPQQQAWTVDLKNELKEKLSNGTKQGRSIENGGKSESHTR